VESIKLAVAWMREDIGTLEVPTSTCEYRVGWNTAVVV
jgi:hypothetical protein